MRSLKRSPHPKTLFAAAIILGGSTSINAGQQVPFWKQMSKTSFGPLTQSWPSNCDREAPGSDVVMGVVQGVFGLVDRFAEQALVYDDTLIAEGLQDQFRTIADTGAPVVWIVSRNDKEIVFSYSIPLVSNEEVFNAASKYCGYKKKTVVYEGSSRKCILNAVRNGRITFAISSFQCL